MQITSILLLALSAASIASPVIVDDPNTDFDSTLTGLEDSDAESNGTFTGNRLEKRGTYGWIAAYADDDVFCKGGYAQPRPQIRTGCVNLSPAGDNIGINWGTRPLAFDSLDIYSHADCVNKIETIKAPPKHRRDGPQTCWQRHKRTALSFRSSNQGPDN